MQDEHNGDPSAEDLDAVAEEQAIADATVNKVNSSVCTLCGELATSLCVKCGQDFCDKHYCVVHGTLPSQREPLTDEDGTEHQGRRIRLIGEGWPNSLRMIKDMSDEELEGQIASLQKLLQDAIKTADYSRISISAREYELDYRKHSRYVAAMKRREKLTQGSVRLNSKKHRVSASGQAIPPDIASLMKAFNISYELAVTLKKTLGGQQ